MQAGAVTIITSSTVTLNAVYRLKKYLWRAHSALGILQDRILGLKEVKSSGHEVHA